MSDMSVDRKPLVLVVDDVAANLSVLRMTLNDSGYDVQVAQDGSRAIALAQALAPDLILLDVVMPGMDGYETCRQLKSDARTCDIPIIFLSVLTQSEDKVRAFEAGGVDFVDKPFQPPEVLMRVKTHLAIRQLQQQLQVANQRLEAQLDDLVQMQAAQQKSEARLKAFVSALPTVTCILDGDGRFVEVLSNPEGIPIFAPEFVVGRTMQDILPARESRLLLDSVQRTLSTGETEVIEYQLPMNGAMRWFEGRTSVMTAGEGDRCQAVFIATDITRRMRLYEEVQRLATQDPLTGCYNRRHFFAVADQEFSRAVRFQRPVSVVMLDADHFKHVNDTYGHPVGDHVLMVLAQCCQTNIRHVDVLARYGGDEFALLLPETDDGPALRVAERLRRQVASLDVDTGRGALKLTISLGVASLDPATDLTFEQLITRADDALYAAKMDGRNQVRNSRS